MTEKRETAEVVIVGAGPAGSALAAHLASRGHDALLLDRATFPRDKTCGDGLTPRAILALARLGALTALRTNDYHEIHGARLIAPNGHAWDMRFADYDLGLPAYGLVIPRRDLDETLLRHAIARGARFREAVDVTGPLHDPAASGRQPAVVGIQGKRGGESFRVQARLTALATGAAIGLLRTFDVLQAMPPGVNAIRGYFDGVADLEDRFEFYFERDLAPGYAWVFPMAEGRANIGLGLFSRGRAGPAPNLRVGLSEFIRRHPRLRDATPVGPAKGYPIRIDFPSSRVIGEGYLVVGEAAGLVNPVTGEGIDLALESAEMAADAISAALAAGDTTARGLRAYERALHARYAGFFRGVRLLLRLATGPRALNVLIRQAQHRPRLARTIAGINLGVTSPWQAFSPRTWWEILRR
jgi:geranylgeranyl reductase family protein